jgi:alginate O-acetyltransferase complex protein AlgI
LSFTSVDFLLFLALLTALYRVFPSGLRFGFLLVTSYVFYSSAGLLASLLLVGVTLFAFVAAMWIDRSREQSASKVPVLIAVILLGAYLMFFKVAVVMPKDGLLSWVMPLGLSYYTFKLIGYVIDVYWGTAPAEKRLIPFATYVAFFPQIVAGPIHRSDFFAQRPHPGAVQSAVPRIAWGIAKKLIIADHLAPAVNYVFSHVTAPHVPLWIGFYVWPMQLYADFSGLTDIAIGSGLLFGIRGPENFNRPFTACSISDYWRRWHISLTSWLKDYVFTPLRMATRNAGNLGLAFSITVNMVAIGLWHGLTWGYFVFGTMHSLFLSVDALTARRRRSWFKKHANFDKIGGWFGVLLTFHLVALALVFFRARTVADAWSLLFRMWAGLTTGISDLSQLEPQIYKSLLLGLTGYLILELCERFRPDRWAHRLVDTGPRFMRWSLYAGALLLITFGFLLLIASGGGPNNPFVYAIF